jgi:hypothetical protein
MSCPKTNLSLFFFSMNRNRAPRTSHRPRRIDETPTPKRNSAHPMSNSTSVSCMSTYRRRETLSGRSSTCPRGSSKRRILPPIRRTIARCTPPNDAPMPCRTPDARTVLRCPRRRAPVPIRYFHFDDDDDDDDDGAIVRSLIEKGIRGVRCT